MPHSDTDPSVDPVWQAEQADRLLGFEVLSHVMRGDYHPVAADALADKVGIDKNLTHRILEKLRPSLNG